MVLLVGLRSLHIVAGLTMTGWSGILRLALICGFDEHPKLEGKRKVRNRR